MTQQEAAQRWIANTAVWAKATIARRMIAGSMTARSSPPRKVGPAMARIAERSDERRRGVSRRLKIMSRVASHSQEWREINGSANRLGDWLGRDEPVPPLTFSLVCDIELLVADRRNKTVASEHEEYLRRNIVHCGSIGVRAGISAALSRLRKTKNPPKWLLAHLDGLVERADASATELAKWRSSAPDAPPAPAIDDGTSGGKDE